MSHVDEGTLHAWLDGELGERRAGEIEEHVAICKRCDALLEEAIREHARAGELLAEAAALPAGAPAFSELVRRSEEAQARATEEQPAPGGLDGGPSFLVPGLAWAATLVLAFFLGWQAQQRSGLAGPEGGIAARPAPVADAGSVAEPDAPVDGLVAEADEAVAELERPVAELERPVVEPATPIGNESLVSEAPPVVPSAEEEAERVEEARRLSAEPPVAELARQEARLGVVDTDGGRARLALSGLQPIRPREAAHWLGIDPLRLPGADLREVAVGPSYELPGVPGRPVLRMVYDDSGSDELITVTQQHVGDEPRLPPRPQQIVELEPQPRAASQDESQESAAGTPQRLVVPDDQVWTYDGGDVSDRTSYPRGLESAILVVNPDGRRQLRWMDSRGYLVIIEAALSEERLRELAAALR